MSDLASYETVTTGYYRDPDAGLAAAALRHWLRMVAEADEPQLARMMVLFYVFARISQSSEPARDAFEPILRGFEGPHAEIAARLLQVPSDAAFPNALQLPIERPEHLDLLWAEFFVTGEVAPVERIGGALDGDDRVRRRLEVWVREASLFGRAKRRATAAALADAGLVVDLDRKVIVTTGDLDLACFAIAERRIRIFELLPFGLTPEEVMTFGLKGAALWSLRLNAQIHPKVAELCRRRRIEPAADAPPFAL